MTKWLEKKILKYVVETVGRNLSTVESEDVDQAQTCGFIKKWQHAVVKGRRGMRRWKCGALERRR